MVRALFLSAVTASISLSTGGVAAAGDAAEQGAKPAKIADWRNLKFGLMMTWGLYSAPGGVWKGKNISGYDEQIMHRASIPREEYVQLATRWARRVPTAVLMRLMRHESIQTTNAYYVNLNADEVAEDLYRFFGGVGSVFASVVPADGENGGEGE